MQPLDVEGPVNNLKIIIFIWVIGLLLHIVVINTICPGSCFVMDILQVRSTMLSSNMENILSRKANALICTWSLRSLSIYTQENKSDAPN